MKYIRCSDAKEFPDSGWNVILEASVVVGEVMV